MMKFKRPKERDIWPFSLHETLGMLAVIVFAFGLATSVRYVRADPDCRQFTVGHCDEPKPVTDGCPVLAYKAGCD